MNGREIECWTNNLEVAGSNRHFAAGKFSKDFCAHINNTVNLTLFPKTLIAEISILLLSATKHESKRTKQTGLNTFVPILWTVVTLMYFLQSHKQLYTSVDITSIISYF